MTTAEVLGLNIGEYDQVVAISQSAINLTLQYRSNFRNWATALKMRFPKLACSVTGQLEEPTVQLDDRPGGNDQVRFMVKLTPDSVFTFNENDSPVEVPVGGTVLVYDVPLRLETLQTMDEALRKQILDPGSYTVSQISLDFGSAKFANFHRVDSKYVGFTDALLEQYPLAQDTFVMSVTNHVLNLARANKTMTGVAATAVKPKIHSTNQASFPPTAVRLQTIFHWPKGDRELARPEDDRNVFLFTEMCQINGKSNPMPTKDLGWTSNWIVPPCNGAFVMTKRIYYDQYLRPVFVDLVKQLNLLLNTSINVTNDAATSYPITHGFPNTPWVYSHPDPPFHELMKPTAMGDHMSWKPDMPRNYRPVNTYTKWLSSSANVEADVVINPNTADISFKFHGTATVLKHGTETNETFDRQTKFWSEIILELDVNFSSFVDGKLHATKRQKRCTASCSFEYPGGWRVGTPVGPTHPIIPSLYKVINDFDTKILDDVSLALSGGTTFMFKDPTFLNNGDLYIKLFFQLRDRDDQKTIDRTLADGK